MTKADHDSLKALVYLQQCAIDVLLASHPQRDKLAAAFETQSDAYIRMITQGGYDQEALEAVQLMRRQMLKRLGRTEH